jgi:phage-related protein
MNGTTSITFNQTRLDSLGCGWQTKSRPTSPSKKVFVYSPSARDGEYDMSTYNPDNRPHFEMIEIIGSIYVVNGTSLQNTHVKIQELMRFLHSANGKPADFVFDDSPDRIFRATFQDSAPITGYENRKGAILTVTFKVFPFPRSAETEIDLTLTSGSTTVLLPTGSAHTKPIFTLTGAFSSITIKSVETGRQLVYSGISVIGNTTIIDFTLEQVQKNGVDFNEYITGDFWELSPYSADTNACLITVVGTANIDIKYDKLEVY